MAKIKRLTFFDKFALKKNKLFSLDTDEYLFLPFDFLHQVLPLRFKFMPESYISTENNTINGLISLSKIHGNSSRIALLQLCFSENDYSTGQQLIEYIIAEYASKGATSFIVKIDENSSDLLNLFSSACGFRQCSFERLWEINKSNLNNNSELFIRPFKNSDSQKIAQLFNDKIITHFKPSLKRDKKEFEDIMFQGLTHKQIFKYISENKQNSEIETFITISTSDNYNYSAEIIFPDYLEPDYSSVFNFVNKVISKRTKDFKLYTKSLGYLMNNDKYENYLRDQGHHTVNTRIVLTKDFYKEIKEPSAIEKLVMLNTISTPTST